MVNAFKCPHLHNKNKQIFIERQFNHKTEKITRKTSWFSLNDAFNIVFRKSSIPALNLINTLGKVL